MSNIEFHVLAYNGYDLGTALTPQKVTIPGMHCVHVWWRGMVVVAAVVVVVVMRLVA